MKNFKDFKERLKVCWHVLTKQNYAFFAVNENALVFDDNGNYDHIQKDGVASYSNVLSSWFYKTSNGKKKTFGWFFWGSVKDFAQMEEQKYEETYTKSQRSR